MLSTYMIIMLILFLNFYIHEYVTRSNDAKRRKQKLEQTGKAAEAGSTTATKSIGQNGTRKKQH
jgi:hypothetical protein